MKPPPPDPPPTRLVAEHPPFAVGVAVALLFVLLFMVLYLAVARADDNDELCQRGAKITVEGFAKENPDLPAGFFKMENVKLAFPTIDGVICQADFVFSDPRIAKRTDTFPVRHAEDGKIKVCNRRGKCTPPQ